MTGAGYLVNLNDIAGPFSGIVFGVSNTIGTVPGLLSPYIASVFTSHVSWFNSPIFITRKFPINLCICICFRKANSTWVAGGFNSNCTYLFCGRLSVYSSSGGQHSRMGDCWWFRAAQVWQKLQNWKTNLLI